MEKERMEASYAEDGILHHALHVLLALRDLKEHRQTLTSSIASQRDFCQLYNKPPIVM